ncbi:hypothetical protein GCM10007391_03370 [Alteromonas halophila]|uniref:Bacteriocin n=1 Tax=Alteromonas halophila TaxID=516698 RepID=A0A918JCV3_9ALTE|nr:hypothetical protein GCM10007391_03370 [Alteromonas halophila]
MQILNTEDVMHVSGAYSIGEFGYDVGYSLGYVFGGAAGHDLGIWIYDLTH